MNTRKLESHHMKMPPIPINPWYREPWPWLLMLGPAIVVVAGIITIVIAVRTQDGLVVDDYYKQGLAVNRDLSRDLAAKTAGLVAQTSLDTTNRRVTLTLVNSRAALNELTLTLSRAAATGFDQRITLQRTHQRNDESTFIGALKPLESGKWYVTLEDPSRAWRLMTAIAIQDSAAMSFSMGNAEPGVVAKP